MAAKRYPLRRPARTGRVWRGDLGGTHRRAGQAGHLGEHRRQPGRISAHPLAYLNPVCDDIAIARKPPNAATGAANRLGQ